MCWPRLTFAAKADRTGGLSPRWARLKVLHDLMLGNLQLFQHLGFVTELQKGSRLRVSSCDHPSSYSAVPITDYCTRYTHHTVHVFWETEIPCWSKIKNLYDLLYESWLNRNWTRLMNLKSLILMKKMIDSYPSSQHTEFRWAEVQGCGGRWRSRSRACAITFKSSWQWRSRRWLCLSVSATSGGLSLYCN